VVDGACSPLPVEGVRLAPDSVRPVLTTGEGALAGVAEGFVNSVLPVLPTGSGPLVGVEE
jgi:hypothetical protein